jgi:hypothetical protein
VIGGAGSGGAGEEDSVGSAAVQKRKPSPMDLVYLSCDPLVSQRLLLIGNQSGIRID